MAKLTGTLHKSELEGGLWILETAAGDRYQLKGALGGAKDGAHATVTGKVERALMGIGMAGPIVSVEKLDVK